MCMTCDSACDSKLIINPSCKLFWHSFCKNKMVRTLGVFLVVIVANHELLSVIS